MTRKSKVERAHCPHCDGERSCLVHGSVSKRWTWKDYRFSVDGQNIHSLLECKGCETVFYHLTKTNSEDVDYYTDEDGEMYQEYNETKSTYPVPESKIRPTWLDSLYKIDKTLHEILNQVYIAYDNDAYILATLGMRTAFDRGTEFLGIKPSLRFEKKLGELKDKGWVGDAEKSSLEILVNAGSAAAHRGWDPDKAIVDDLLFVLESFIQRAIVTGAKIIKIKDQIPQKTK